LELKCPYTCVANLSSGIETFYTKRDKERKEKASIKTSSLRITKYY